MEESFVNLNTLCTGSSRFLPEYKQRLSEELKEISATDNAEYFLELVDKGDKYANENNLLVPFLLGVCDDFDPDKPPSVEYGDFPDIDCDFLPKVKEYLKEEYCRKTFGEEYCCNIATYTKFGIRSSLIDMARVLGLDRKEILEITTDLHVKDDEGEVLTWDKAVELYDNLRDYLNKYPELAKAAQKLINRNRGMGIHASGLIIAGVPLKDFVPLVKPKQDGQIASAWVEGLSGTDLGAVGLIKFDFLGLDATQKIAEACRLMEDYDRACAVVKEFDDEKICALPGSHNWSDLSYLNDKESLEMADKGHLKMVFQFDGSLGIRKLAKLGGVTSFDDLVAYTSLFRPSAMKSNMHLDYCARKRGVQKYDIHPLLQSILGYTYGVLVYQEQAIRILHVVGKIPLKDCEMVRKAISKKKLDKFQKYKDIFVKNGQVTLGWDEEKTTELWNFIEDFSGYGFNLSHATAYTYNSARTLYLKRHRPKKFFPSFLNNTHPTGPEDYQKLKEYIQEANKFGSPVEKPDINLSKHKFKWVDGKLHYPFNKIKGLGEEVAQRIESLQPYRNYQDFIERFGSDAKANVALIALGLFKEKDRKTLYQFYESYKEYDKKCKYRDRMFNMHQQKFIREVKEMTGIDVDVLAESVVEEVFNNFPESHGLYRKVLNLCRRYLRVLETHQKKLDEPRPQIDSFVPSEIKDKEIESLLTSPIEQAEELYLGFRWLNPVEAALGKPSELTIENYELQGWHTGPVEVIVNGVKEQTSKKGTKFYVAEIEDANGRKKWVNIWNADYNQFKQELVRGNVVVMRLKSPTPPYKTYSLADSGKRFGVPPKQQDFRVTVIKWREQ